ncbi:MAG: CPBP family intramembrane metalloprotease [Ignavibacteriaceae bacterium]|nr:CPBP family intramembrane metalloprotease [Ignavibacteriaceae bacterium]
MNKKKFSISKELPELTEIIKRLDKKVLTIFLSIAVLQTVSWYYTSRMFFRFNLLESFGSSPNVNYYEFAYWYIGDFITLFVIPALIIKLFLKEKIKDYGIRLGDYNAGIKLSVLFLIVMVPLIWLATSQPVFSITYPLLDQARDSWKVFIFYEIGLIFYLFAWEFIWRGYMLFGLKENFGYYAVIIQMIPFLILHNGKPPIETFGAILGGIALGILAYRTQSIYYCIVTHAGIMISIDFFSTLRHRAGDFGIGLHSILNVLKQII